MNSTSTKTIEIIVSPEGKSRIETKGFVGEECRQASRVLETALGNCTTETLTAEFHQNQPQKDALRQRH